MSENKREFTPEESAVMWNFVKRVKEANNDLYRTPSDLNMMLRKAMRLESISDFAAWLFHKIEAGNEPCQRCKGGGIEQCYRCGGVGWLSYSYEHKREDCQHCASLGAHKCTRCHGSGWEQ